MKVLGDIYFLSSGFFALILILAWLSGAPFDVSDLLLVSGLLGSIVYIPYALLRPKIVELVQRCRVTES
jgi:hypothetical protein